MGVLKLYLLTTLLLLLFGASHLSAHVESKGDDLYVLLQRSSILFGLTVISRPDMVNTECYKNLQELQNGMLQKKPWAMKMYDASGSRPPGFLLGNGHWLGNRDTCDAVKQPANLIITKHIPRKMNPQIITDIAPFPTDFRVVNLWHNSSWQVDPVYLFFEPRVNIGLCLPSKCTLTEIAQLMGNYVDDDLFTKNDIYDLRLRVESVKDLKLRPGVLKRPSSVIFLFCFFLTLLLTFLAFGRRNQRINGKVVIIEETTESNDDSKQNQRVETAPFGEKGFIDCFDIQNNWELLFPTSKRSQLDEYTNLPAVDGIRFYGSTAVILYHQLCFSYLGVGIKTGHHTFTSTLGNFEIFVDVFFTISGFLQTYHFFRNTKTLDTIRKSNLAQNTKMVFLYIIHRLIRLGPLYLIITCLTDIGWLISDDFSVFHYSYRVYENCELHWWRNMFFIQNLFNHNELCMLWSWSSACDMQFYVLSVILLFVFVKHPNTGKAVTLSILAANLAYTFYVGLTMNFQYSLESTTTLFTEIYMNPLSRVMPYLIGCVAGWFFVQNQQQQHYAKFFQNQSLQEYLGYLAIILFFTCNLTTLERGHTVLFYVVTLVVQRFVFSASICCLIFANAAGCVGWFFYLLDNPVFKKLSQLAYALFLMNPLPVGVMTSLSNESVYWSPSKFVLEFIGYCVILYFFCTIFALLFEVPYKNISKLLMRRTKAKTS